MFNLYERLFNLGQAVCTVCICLLFDHWKILPVCLWHLVGCQIFSGSVKQKASASGFGEEIMKLNSSLFPFPPFSHVGLFVAVKLYPVSILALIMNSGQFEQEEKNIKWIPCVISSLAELHKRCLWPSVPLSNRTFCIVIRVCRCYLKIRGSFLSQVAFQT